MSIVRFQQVTREIGTFVILDAIDAAIALGDRIGLVGPNGAGKTTLLRLAVGRDAPDRGSVQRKRGLSIGLLSQEAHFDAAFMAAPDLRTAVRTGAAHLEAMGAELTSLERDGHAGAAHYADLQHRFEALGGYTLDQRVEAALSGVGFPRDEWTKPPTSLSGGEQTRAALARLVITDPDLLLLDEPTNHLDLDALEWLEEHLRRRTGSLLVASHDRAFLDATVTRIWELRDRKLTTFRGDYRAFHRQREERDLRAEKEADTWEEQIARERELIQRYRSQRKFSKMHEHEARLEKLLAERREAPKRQRKLTLPQGALTGSGPSRSGEVVVRVEDLVVGYLPGRGAVDADGAPVTEPRPVARVPVLAAQRGDRIGIVGPNGAGKTTLLRTIAGELPPLDGSLTFGHNTSIGYLAQLRDAALPGTTVLDALTEAIPVTDGEARGYLARFLFRGDDVFKEVRALSGGERSRLELALLGIQPSNLLLLDEPTNHLDIPAREAIESFMRDSPATLLVVSHDRRLLETVCDRLWVVGDGQAVAFEGGYRAWRQAVAGGWTVATAIEEPALRGRPTATKGPAGPAPSAPVTPPVAARLVPRAPRGRQPKLSKDAYKRQRSTLDVELTRLGLRKNHLELAMGDPAVAANFVELRRVTSELADVSAALDVAESAWLEMEERAP
ncbi:MAG: ABC-F family ATP-binding cassette domain-containing protein [Chloroflexota bacterium]